MESKNAQIGRLVIPASQDSQGILLSNISASPAEKVESNSNPDYPKSEIIKVRPTYNIRWAALISVFTFFLFGLVVLLGWVLSQQHNKTLYNNKIISASPINYKV